MSGLEPASYYGGHWRVKVREPGREAAGLRGRVVRPPTPYTASVSARCNGGTGAAGAKWGFIRCPPLAWAAVAVTLPPATPSPEAAGVGG